MKKILITVLAAFCFLAAPVAALEWGGLVNNETKGSTTNLKDINFHQSNGIFLWANAPLNSTGSWSFSTEGMYKYSFDVSDGTKNFSNTADLDLLKISGNIKMKKGGINLSAGRFTVADNTGVNFSQCCDGLSLNATLGKITLGAYAGYTGLLNSLNVTMLNGTTATTNDFYNFAHKYVPAVVTFGIPSFIANQSLSIQGEAFIDLEANPYNRLYGNVALSGPVAGTVYYNLVSSFGFVDNNLMNYSSFKVSAFPSSSIAFNAGVEYASGNQGPFKPYVTFTSKTAYGAGDYPEMTGCLVPGMDFIYTSGAMFVNLAVKAGIAMPDSSAKFRGIGGDLTFIYNIFSDLQAEVDVSAFKDIADAGAVDLFSATAKFAISF